jgi:hypothetical protein
MICRMPVIWVPSAAARAFVAHRRKFQPIITRACPATA